MKRPRYPSDLTDAQWARLEPLLPPCKSGRQGGRPRSVHLREVLNAIFYFLKGCGGWRYLPHDLPPWGTVHYYYRQWRLDGTWSRIHTTLREQVRQAAGRSPTPSAAVLDSQSVKTGKKGGLGAGTRAKRSKDANGICW